MNVTINDKTYAFTVRGTVGLVYMAERTLGCAFDSNDKYHHLVLLYCCLVASNPGKSIDMMEFISTLTTASLNSLTAYFWQEWRRLEGESEQKEEDAQGEG